MFMALAKYRLKEYEKCRVICDDMLITPIARMVNLVTFFMEALS